MVAGAVEEDLGFVFEAAKGAGVDDAVAVALEFGAPGGGGFGMDAAAGLGAKLGVGGERLAFALFELLSGTRHGKAPAGISWPGVPGRRCRAVRRGGGWRPRSGC